VGSISYKECRRHNFNTYYKRTIRTGRNFTLKEGAWGILGGGRSLTGIWKEGTFLTLHESRAGKKDWPAAIPLNHSPAPKGRAGSALFKKNRNKGRDEFMNEETWRWKSPVHRGAFRKGEERKGPDGRGGGGSEGGCFLGGVEVFLRWT